MKRTEQREQAFVLVFEKIFSDVDNEELIEIYNDGLGLTALYYLFASLFIYIRWEYFSNKK